MPKDFEQCVREGGRVRTVKPNKQTFMPVCYDRRNKSHAGYARRTKGRSRGK